MSNISELGSYYRKAHPFFPRFLKEIFSNMSGDTLDKLKKSVGAGEVFENSSIPLDDIFLFESWNFLRLSSFNLLAYKFLMCGRYLAWGKVTLYYSYFYSVNSLLRLVGRAVIHATDLDGKIFPFQLQRQKDSHQYLALPRRGSEHKFLWNTFSSLFPDLSSTTAGMATIEDRVRWNYEILFPSQSTQKHALRESEIYCENNFLRPNFDMTYSEEEAEHIQELIANYGYEEMYAGDLIKRSLELLSTIGRLSDFRNEYLDLITSFIPEIEMFESKRETKQELQRIFRNAIRSIQL